jgi:energy-coupling factor transporter ATP-binding protein EcfA2
MMSKLGINGIPFMGYFYDTADTSEAPKITTNNVMRGPSYVGQPNNELTRIALQLPTEGGDTIVDLPPGGHVIIGTTGSGKSTLARSIRSTMPDEVEWLNFYEDSTPPDVTYYGLPDFFNKIHNFLEGDKKVMIIDSLMFFASVGNFGNTGEGGVNRALWSQTQVLGDIFQRFNKHLIVLMNPGSLKIDNADGIYDNIVRDLVANMKTVIAFPYGAEVKKQHSITVYSRDGESDRTIKQYWIRNLNEQDQSVNSKATSDWKVSSPSNPEMVGPLPAMSSVDVSTNVADNQAVLISKFVNKGK